MDKSFLDTGYMTGYNYSRYRFFELHLFQGGYSQAMDTSDNDANPDNADNYFNMNIY